MNRRVYFFLPVLIVLCVGPMLAQSSPSSAPPAAPIVRAGENVVIEGSSSGVLFLGKDPKTFREVLEVGKKGDVDSMKQLLASKKAFIVKNGTFAEVKKVRGDIALVKIATGDEKGNTGWILTRFLTKM